MRNGTDIANQWNVALLGGTLLTLYVNSILFPTSL
jgi:hypothetical protein